MTTQETWGTLDGPALWERAERYAKARRLPMSALIMTALEQFLADET